MTRPFDISKIPAPPSQDLERAKAWLNQRNGRPLIVEIGSGVGMHAIQLAKKWPEANVIAIERTTEKFHKLERRVKNHSFDNLLALHAEATVFLPHFLNEREVSQFYFMYPNPYPKASQKNLRWGHSPFLTYVYQKLTSSGDLFFATNIQTYKDELVSQIPQFGFQMQNCSLIPPDADPRTHFEKKYLQRGETCWDLHFKK